MHSKYCHFYQYCVCKIKQMNIYVYMCVQDKGGKVSSDSRDRVKRKWMEKGGHNDTTAISVLHFDRDFLCLMKLQCDD